MRVKHPFKLADSFEFRLLRQKIEWEFAPQRAQWKAIIDRWDRMIDMVNDWLDAHCAFAPQDGRWADPPRTQTNIARTKECMPGRLQVREAIFKEYFGLSWDDIWSHPTYIAEVKACRIFNSDEKMELIKQAYPLCKPGGKVTSELIAKNEELFKSNRLRNLKHLERFGTKENPGPGYTVKPFAEFVKNALAETP